mgnify:CR=1 FL=1
MWLIVSIKPTRNSSLSVTSVTLFFVRFFQSVCSAKYRPTRNVSADLIRNRIIGHSSFRLHVGYYGLLSLAFIIAIANFVAQIVDLVFEKSSTFGVWQ